MIRNNSNNLMVNGGKPRKMDGTHHIMRYAYDGVYRLLFRGIPLSTKKLLHSFRK